MNTEKVVYTLEEVKVLVDEARRRERERCAKLCDETAAHARKNPMWPAYCLNAVESTADELANAIRG